MATDVERLVVQLEANMRGYERAMQRAGQQTDTTARQIESRFRRANQGVERQFRSLQRTAVAALGAIGVALSARAFQQMISGALQAAEALADMSRQANASIEGLQELRFAADQNGSSAGALDRGLRRLSATMGQVFAGRSDTATQQLERLGLQQRIVSGEIRTSDQMFRALAERLEQVSDANERAAIVTNIFGERLGGELRQALSLGSQGLEEATRRARELGLVLDRDLVEQGARANAELRAMGDQIRTGVNRAVLENVDSLRQLAEAWAEVMRNAVAAGAAIARALNLGQGMAGRDPAAAAQTVEEVAQMLVLRASGARGRRTGAGGFNTAGNQELALLRRALGTEAAEAMRPQLVAIAENRDALLEFAGSLRARAAELRETPPPAPAEPPSATPPQTPPGTPAAAGRPGAHFGPEQWSPDPIRAAMERFLADAELYEQTLAEQAAKLEATAKAASDASDEIGRFNTTLEWTIANGVRDLEQAFVDFVLGAELSFDRMARNVLANLARMAFQQAIGNPLERAMAGLFSGGIRFGGGKADGGAVAAGVRYRVGERGPETLVMNRPGHIIPDQTAPGGMAARPAPVVRLLVRRGEMFDAEIERISGAVSVETLAGYDSARREQQAVAVRRDAYRLR